MNGQKKIIIAITILAIPFHALSQHELVDFFFDKYASNEKISDISLNGWILGMASKMLEDEGTDILKKITKLRIMFTDEKDIGSKAEIKKSGGFVIYGRSDTTLNPGGVRLGTKFVDVLVNL